MCHCGRLGKVQKETLNQRLKAWATIKVSRDMQGASMPYHTEHGDLPRSAMRLRGLWHVDATGQVDGRHCYAGSPIAAMVVACMRAMK